ncbi:hypothetical protein ABPG75_009069 [Micractinium tetrahymenae]
MPTPSQAAQSRRQATQQLANIAAALQRATDADQNKANAQKAVLDATLTNLRTKLTDLESDNWLYEAPRYSYQ